MRTILHSDLNACYANIELLHHPELRGRPVAVGGDPERRHGIVLAKSQEAKKMGVKTGMALWEAKQACPDIVFVPAHMDLYMRFSALARSIYLEYTDKVEAFGIDECWMDVTDSASCKGDGLAIAEEIRSRIRRELGLTVSIGVSWNKIFAKFGSDYKKPDAVTEITEENYRDIVWSAPAGDLLYVGRATLHKLYKMGIITVGDIARAEPEMLQLMLGKMGLVLYMFARGEDRTPVEQSDFTVPIKSIGNGCTTPRDLITDEDVKIVLYVLAESVSARLRKHGFKGNVVEINIRDNGLYSFTRQKKLEAPTDLTVEIADTAQELFSRNYTWEHPIRSVGVRSSGLVEATVPIQTSLFVSEERKEKLHRVDVAVDSIRSRFGRDSIARGILYKDPLLAGVYAKSDQPHPRGYFENGNRTGIELLHI